MFVMRYTVIDIMHLGQISLLYCMIFQKDQFVMRIRCNRYYLFRLSYYHKVTNYAPKLFRKIQFNLTRDIYIVTNISIQVKFIYSNIIEFMGRINLTRFFFFLILHLIKQIMYNIYLPDPKIYVIKINLISLLN